MNLTNREMEVLDLISKGYSNKEIATKLLITTHTVKAHTSSIKVKLNAKTSPEAVYKAVKQMVI